jgi:hypothetical protein
MAGAPGRKRTLIIVVVVVAIAIAAAVVVKVATQDSNGHGMASSVPVDGYFKTLPVGAALPSDATCAARVHRTAWEPRGGNTIANHVKPKQPVVLANDPAYDATFQQTYKPRVTGNFTGTTDEIFQWAACKWGLADNMVRAQAVEESHWHQNTESDFEPKSSGHCPQGEERDPCPTSFGILQIKWYFHPSLSPVDSSYPMSKAMTAFSVDYEVSEMRGCYDGHSFEGEKAKGDLFGCMGIWFAGALHTGPADEYIDRVKHSLDKKPWLKWRGTATP